MLHDNRDPQKVATNSAGRLGLPVMLKPISEGGSIGMRVLRDVDTLAAALAAEGPAGEGHWFLEPFVGGTAVTCGVLQTGTDLVALPPLETIPVGTDFYDYAAKRDPARHRYRCPARVAGADQVPALALAVHQAMGCSGYSRADFLLTPTGDAYFLEVNTLPGLSQHGNFAVMANTAGIGYDELVATLIATARHDPGYRP